MCQARVANFQPSYDYRIPAGSEIIADAFANCWIDCMKLVVCSTIPDILLFFKAESGSTRFKLRCWYFRAGNRQAESSLSRSIGSLIAWNVDMTGNPAVMSIAIKFGKHSSVS